MFSRQGFPLLANKTMLTKKLIPELIVITGKPGCGKTSYASRVARHYLNNKIPVFSNVPIQGTYKLSRDYLFKYNISDCVVIFDEASFEFDSRKFNSFKMIIINFLGYIVIIV